MINAAELFAIGFGLWAGVVGLGVRLVVSRLADMDDRVRAIEIEFAETKGKCG